MPYILQVFHQDISEKRIPTICTLKTLIVFDTILDDYLHVIVPQIVNLFDLNEIPLDVRIAAIKTIGSLTENLDFNNYSELIIHPLIRCVNLVTSKQVTLSSTGSVPGVSPLMRFLMPSWGLYKI